MIKIITESIPNVIDGQYTIFPKMKKPSNISRIFQQNYAITPESFKAFRMPFFAIVRIPFVDTVNLIF